MSIIRVLPPEVANRIAAGEVIERPASVVKELVENALDAGARRIRVQTSHGGQRLIQVTDDGGGMDRDDALLCLEAHATSKIRDLADVGQIQTLGFRGEALPSIAAVSRFLLQTRPPESPSGTEILVEAGILKDVRDCGCAPGTNVRVTHLFSNLPARRKFLRTPDTEDGHIHEVVLLQALAQPGVAFEYLADQREAVRVAATGDLATRVGMVMGRDLFAEMVPVDYEEEGIRVQGYAGKPGVSRTSRREQRLFVNGRPASADSVYYGIREAYTNLVLRDRYPPVVLYVELAPERVDVNVHPAKREVRFREARVVSQVVCSGVARALRGMVSLTPESAPNGTRAGVVNAAPGPTLPAARPFRLSAGALQPRLPLQQVPRRPAPAAGAASALSASPPLAAPAPASALTTAAPATGSAAAPAAPAAVAPPPVASTPAPAAAGAEGPRQEISGLRVLGSVRGQYLVAEGPRGVVLLDPVAAHQRILFEHLLRNAASSQVLRQQLLLPVTVDLGPEDARRLREHLESLLRFGFSIDPFSGNTFLVSAVPARFPPENVGGLLRDILDDLSERGRTTPGSEEVRIARAAARHAVASRRVLNEREVSELIRDLARAEMPYTDPSGQPVLINIPFPEIERRFGRRDGQ
jgi:DNA mismatch repair protein MutL